MNEIEKTRKEIEEDKERMRKYLDNEMNDGFVDFFEYYFNIGNTVGHWEYAIALHLLDFEKNSSKLEGFNLGVQLARKEFLKILDNEIRRFSKPETEMNKAMRFYITSIKQQLENPGGKHEN